MALNFPSSPTNGQIYTDANTGQSYIYNSTYGFWQIRKFAIQSYDTQNNQILFSANGYVAGSNGIIYDPVSNTFYANTVNVTGYLYGNGAFLTGVVSDFSPAFNQANIAFAAANAAFAQANSVSSDADEKANAAIITANAAYDKANSANSLAFNTGVGANAYAAVVGTSANTFASATIAGANAAVGTGANSFATSATIAANNYAGIMANASNAFASAVGVAANTVGSSAFITANAAFAYANTISSDADEKANAAIVTANAAYDKANAANVLAFNALPNTTATFAGDLTVTGNVIVNGNQGITVRESDVGFYYDSVSAGALELTHTNDASGNYFEFLTTDAASQLRITTAGNNIVMLPGQNFGIGTSTPAVKLDVDGGANVSSALTVAGMNVVPTIQAAFAKANSVSSDADEKANAAIITANAAYDKANAANLLAFDTGIGANAFAAGVGSNANLFASATIAGANSAVGTGANSFATTATVAANNYAGIMANAANNFANNKFLANSTGTFQGTLTLAPTFNLSIDTSGKLGFGTTFPAIIQATDGLGTGSITFRPENTSVPAVSIFKVGTVSTSNITGALTANGGFGVIGNVHADGFWFKGSNVIQRIVDTGTSANTFASETIAGANTAVGTGANAFSTSATIAANNYAGVMANAANAFMISTVSGANTIASSAFDKANAANVLAFNTGTGANAFTSIAFDAANAAFAQANSVSSDADEKANAAIITANLAFDKANSANIVASNAYDKANAANVLAFNALPNTTATFNGSLTINNDLIVRGNTTLGDANTDTITINGNSITLGNNQSIDAGTLFIDAVNNRVGINTTSFTTSPTAGLEIRKQGAGWYHNSLSHGGLYTEFTTPAGGGSIFTIRTDNGGPQLRFITSGNSIVMLPATGFVGIGATLPTSNLHVIGNTNITSSLIVATINVIPAIASAYDQANAANLLAFNTGIGANAYASGVGSNANLFASATIAGANTAVGGGANAYASAVGVAANNWANTKLSSSGGTITGDLFVTGNLQITGNTLFMNVTRFQVDDPLIYLAGNNYVSDVVDIGFIANYVNATGSNVHTGLYREHTDKTYYLFNGYDQEPINNHIGALSNNMTLAVLNADLRTSNLSLGGVNAITWITSVQTTGNNAYDKANAANVLAFNTGVGANAFAAGVGSNANLFASATIAGANTAVGGGANAYAAVVGTSANAFASATIAGANTAVGTGANAFTSATIAGANTAVGGGANAFATSATIAANNFAGVMANAANAFMISTISGANTAVGAGANAFTSSTIAGANTAVGTGANAFTSATIAGANTAVGTGANSVGIAAFARANASVNVINIGGTITLTSNSTAINVVSSNGVTLAANNFAGVATLNIGLSTTGVTATTYGASDTIIPRITVDAYGRITGASNITVANATLVAISSNNYAGQMANAANAFMSSTVAGANAAVGSAANNFAGVMANAANAFMITVQNGSNTAVGTGANTFASGVGSNANLFASATIAGANAAVGAGANSVGIAAFARANASLNVINVGGTINLTSNSTSINIVASNGISLVANNFAGLATLNIGLTLSGVTATTYGGATFIPAITVDAYGRITSAANIGVSVGGGGGYYQGNSGNVGTTLGLGDIFRVHSNTLTQNVTIVTGNNALAAGPITVATNRTLTIQTGARVSIV